MSTLPPDLSAQVDPIPNEALRYFVRSATNPRITYIVDLSQNEGSGFCQCADFSTRRAKAVKEGHALFTRETQCRHCILAVRYFTITTLRECSRMVRKNDSQPKL